MSKGWHGDSAGHSRAAKKSARKKRTHYSPITTSSMSRSKVSVQGWSRARTQASIKKKREAKALRDLNKPLLPKKKKESSRSKDITRYFKSVKSSARRKMNRS